MKKVCKRTMAADGARGIKANGCNEFTRIRLHHQGEEKMKGATNDDEIEKREWR